MSDALMAARQGRREHMVTEVDDGEALLPLVELALKAGEVILDVYATDFVAQTKADASPVTQADVGAEAVIIEGLGRLAPGIPVIAEEEAAAGRLPAIGDVFFLVDPLDGTREFLARNGEFTVNIALVRDAVPVLGVVYAPAIGVLYGGAAGRAFKADVSGSSLGAIVPISVRPASDPVAAIGSRSHGTLAAAEWLARFPSCSFLSAGSSLKFCLVAEGAADLYPRFGRTMEWDTAAGDAVLRAAGGVVTTLEGSPLTYGKRGQVHDVDFANPAFVAYGDRRLITGAAVGEGER